MDAGRRYLADLHIHSYLSPCASRSMSPAAIADHSAGLGLDIIAVADHNSGANARCVEDECRRAGILAVPAMEICTAEEVHVLAYLPSLDALAGLQYVVDGCLMKGSNRPDIFGEQWISMPEGAIAHEPRLLAAATSLGIDELVGIIHSHGGAAVPAHVDRPSYSVVSVLGFLPQSLRGATLEVSWIHRLADVSAIDEMRGHALVSSSDAHSLDEIGRGCSLLTLDQLTIEAVVAALAGAAPGQVEIE